MSASEEETRPETGLVPQVREGLQVTEEPNSQHEQPALRAPEPPVRARRRVVPVVPIAIAVGVVVMLIAGFWMYKRAASKVNDVALDSEAKPVTIVAAKSSTYRASNRYIATLEPWLTARVGPQLVSAYVDTVIYRPGASVKKGDVLATLDCKSVSAESASVAMAAKALEAKEVALAKEAARLNAMLDGGFVSANDVEKKQAEAATQQAEILAQKAKLLGTSLEVNDCVLRSPFDGEVADRFMDPGAFARPGAPVMTVVDRSTVRVAADIPETDFGLVSPGASVRMRIVATGQSLTAPVTRRTPSADPSTRLVHFEIDVPDPTRSIPVGTTAELSVDAGAPVAAAEIPLIGASVRGDKATVFVVEGNIAKKRSVAVLGEAMGTLYVDPSLVGAQIVTEGRALLNDGDAVKATNAPETTSAVPSPSTAQQKEAPL